MGFYTARTDLEGQLLVLYDGECVLCNTSVSFLMDQDSEGILLFATLQGDTGRTVMERHDQDPDELDSVGYVRGYETDDEVLYQKSTAILKALGDIGGIWRVVSYLWIVPKFLRDFVYDIVAEYRYSWFGKYDNCRIPTEEEREQFLE